MAALHRAAIVQLQHMPHLSDNGATRTPDRNRTEASADMAYVNTSRAASFSSADRISGFFAGVKAAMARRAVYAQTLRELNALTDRELADLGIARASIPAVAHEAAYGK